MRDLTMQDVYSMSKILKKMNLKQDVVLEGKTQEQAGFELIVTVFENLHLAEKEVNGFIASLVGITADEYSQLPFEEGMKYLEEFKNKPGIVNFFKSAGKLMK